jgi:hypothetical protein
VASIVSWACNAEEVDTSGALSQKPAEEWIGKGGAKAKLANEKPQGETIAYDELIKRWSN